MLTIAYVTFRVHPRFEWLAASLARELRANNMTPDDVQVVVIDGRLWHEGQRRRLEMLTAAAGRIRFEHYAPKPTIWQGPHKLTQKEYFCASNARNTAFCYAKGEHVAFVDDLSVLRPGWLAGHIAAMSGKYVLAGTTSKMKNIVVSSVTGEILSYVEFPPGRDSRLRAFPPGLSRCPGSSLFGGTFSVPLDLALRVNGQDEICDGIGGEDYDFGMRLERAGAVVYFSSLCGTYEDEDAHHAETPMVRLDKPWHVPGDGPYTSNHLLNRLMREQTRVWTIGNDLILSEMRRQILAGGEFPIPQEPVRHWVDGQPLSEM